MRGRGKGGGGRAGWARIDSPRIVASPGACHPAVGVRKRPLDAVSARLKLASTETAALIEREFASIEREFALDKRG